MCVSVCVNLMQVSPGQMQDNSAMQSQIQMYNCGIAMADEFMQHLIMSSVSLTSYQVEYYR